MKKTTMSTGVDLGVLQQEVMNATKRLKSAKTAFEKASRELDAATQAHTTSRIQLGNAVNAVRAASAVADIHA